MVNFLDEQWGAIGRDSDEYKAMFDKYKAYREAGWARKRFYNPSDLEIPQTNSTTTPATDNPYGYEGPEWGWMWGADTPTRGEPFRRTGWGGGSSTNTDTLWAASSSLRWSFIDRWFGWDTRSPTSSTNIWTNNKLQELDTLFGGDKRKMYSTLFAAAEKDPTRRGMNGAELITSLNEWYKTYTPETPDDTESPAGTEQGEDKVDNLPEAELPETGVESIDNTVNWAEAQKIRAQATLDATTASRNAVIDTIEKNGLESFKNQEAIIDDRLKRTEETFEEVFKTVEKLEEYANQLFDINVIRAIKAREGQLINRGILTSEQAAGATGGIMTLYRQNAEAQRADIMIKVQEAMKSALIEKNNAVDQILADKWATEQQKGLMLERVNKYYDDIIGAHQTQWSSINQAYNNIMSNAYQQKINIDVAEQIKIVENEVENKFNDERIQKANTDQNSRLDYIMDQVDAADPTLNKYAASILNNYIDDGTFMTIPLTDLVAEILQKSANSLLSDARWTGSGGGGTTYTGGGDDTWTTEDILNQDNTQTDQWDETQMTPDNIEGAANDVLGVSWWEEVADGQYPFWARAIAWGNPNMTAADIYAMWEVEAKRAVESGQLSPDGTANTIAPNGWQQSDLMAQLDAIASWQEPSLAPLSNLEQARWTNISASITNIDNRIQDLEWEIAEINSELSANSYPVGSAYERSLRNDIAQKQKRIRLLKQDAQYLMWQLQQ